MKKAGLVLGILAISFLIIIFPILSSDPSSNTGKSFDSQQTTTETYSDSKDNYSIHNFQEKTKDWMQDQAEDKDYTTDDGGEYYCMGKNDTCPNKTRNAYDLFCSACDPDGDNMEG